MYLNLSTRSTYRFLVSGMFVVSALFLTGFVFADNSQNQSQISSAQVKSYLMGKFNPAKHPAFVKVPQRYANRSGYYLRLETLDAFKKMHAAAKKDGIKLTIRSATRNFTHQSWIWDRKWKSKKKKLPNGKQRALNILKYSSMPGTSRHHWGTDIDLNNFNNSWFESGEGLKVFQWLEANAHTYGYCRPY